MVLDRGHLVVLKHADHKPSKRYPIWGSKYETRGVIHKREKVHGKVVLTVVWGNGHKARYSPSSLMPYNRVILCRQKEKARKEMAEARKKKALFVNDISYDSEGIGASSRLEPILDNVYRSIPEADRKRIDSLVWIPTHNERMASSNIVEFHRKSVLHKRRTIRIWNWSYPRNIKKHSNRFHSNIKLSKKISIKTRDIGCWSDGYRFESHEIHDWYMKYCHFAKNNPWKSRFIMTDLAGSVIAFVWDGNIMTSFDISHTTDTKRFKQVILYMLHSFLYPSSTSSYCKRDGADAIKNTIPHLVQDVMIPELKEEAKRQENSAREYDENAKSYKLRADKFRKKAESIRTHIKSPKIVVTEINKGIRKMLQSKAITKASVVGSNLVLETPDIMLNGQYNVGSYTITIDMESTKVLISSNLVPDGSYQHPHVSENGNPCLGNIELQVEDAIYEGRVLDLVCTLTTFLTTYNSDSPYIHLDEFLSRISMYRRNQSQGGSHAKEKERKRRHIQPYWEPASYTPYTRTSVTFTTSTTDTTTWI